MFTWHHEGRKEALFLELSDQYRIHFLRRTRSMRLAWGSFGTWRLLKLYNELVLQLSSFQCCEGARVRCVEFRIDPGCPGRMIDGTGRAIQYLGVLSMSWETGIERALYLTGPGEDVEEWVVV